MFPSSNQKHTCCDIRKLYSDACGLFVGVEGLQEGAGNTEGVPVDLPQVWLSTLTTWRRPTVGSPVVR